MISPPLLSLADHVVLSRYLRSQKLIRSASPPKISRSCIVKLGTAFKYSILAEIENYTERKSCRGRRADHHRCGKHVKMGRKLLLPKNEIRLLAFTCSLWKMEFLFFFHRSPESTQSAFSPNSLRTFLFTAIFLYFRLFSELSTLSTILYTFLRSTQCGFPVYNFVYITISPESPILPCFPPFFNIFGR